MIKIYHNPRCRKSREVLNFLEESGRDFKVILYMQDKLTVEELSALIKKLNIRTEDLIRKEEALWKTKFKLKNLGDNALINLMTEEPRLMQRPVVTLQDRAVIARPLEAIEQLF